MKNEKAMLGQPVRVSKQLVKDSSTVDISHTVVPCSIIGFISGFRNLPYGEVVYRRDAFDHFIDNVQFIQKGTIPCVLVVYHPRRNPIRVPMDAWELLDLSEDK